MNSFFFLLNVNDKKFYLPRKVGFALLQCEVRKNAREKTPNFIISVLKRNSVCLKSVSETISAHRICHLLIALRDKTKIVIDVERTKKMRLLKLQALPSKNPFGKRHVSIFSLGYFHYLFLLECSVYDFCQQQR